MSLMMTSVAETTWAGISTVPEEMASIQILNIHPYRALGNARNLVDGRKTGAITTNGPGPSSMTRFVCTTRKVRRKLTG